MSADSSTRKIFLASFMTLIAAGLGFAIRGAILSDWASQYGFTKQELGDITGLGLVGFGVTIIFFSLFVDLVGYKTLMLGAFLLHLLSAALTLPAGWVFEHFGKDATFWTLSIGQFIFALANGMCEAVINPLTATLYPKQKTHYLNILHAGWPGGLILGAVIAMMFVGQSPLVTRLSWEWPMAAFLIPTFYYGYVTLREHFPESEASAAKVPFGEMISQFASPILLLLLVLHALVGYVELGTDSWIMNIMENVVQGQETLLFIYTSAIMFILRFFAGPIVERINPLGLLFASSLLGVAGLLMLGTFNTVGLIFLAGTIYGVGKTFLWPTMLGVVGERFPKGGALVMGAMGGIGMLSAGLIGAPAIGYKQDYYASQALEKTDPVIYEKFAVAEPRGFLFLPAVRGLDGNKVGAVLEKKKELDKLGVEEQAEFKAVSSANLIGGQTALRWTATVPGLMAVGYLLLLVYFKLTGGYKVVDIRH